MTTLVLLREETVDDTQALLSRLDATGLAVLRSVQASRIPACAQWWTRSQSPLGVTQW